MTRMGSPTVDEVFVLTSEKRQRFWLQVRTTYVLPSFQLIRIIRSVESYSPLMRASALRNLVCSAPYEVTRGRCYSERRRLVRAYFGV